MSFIKDNLKKVEQQIIDATAQACREKTSVTLLAVSKTRTADEIREAYKAGQQHFGENYLQESLDKIATLQDLQNICWHFIGPIQSNKTRPVAEHFDWVHSVDRLKVARRLSEQRPVDAEPLNICLQVNISQEASKAGCLPDEAEALANEVSQLPGIRLRGLMAIPKAESEPQQQRQAFARMQQLFNHLKTNHPALDTLSMGMSGDMTMAIAEGATIVRIGTAIFGPRDYSHTDNRG
ncbi:MAG: YggS family pyridoxal phosphate-dependent enzyme [Pontibacterium sp.]